MSQMTLGVAVVAKEENNNEKIYPFCCEDSSEDKINSLHFLLSSAFGAYLQCLGRVASVVWDLCWALHPKLHQPVTRKHAAYIKCKCGCL